MRLSLNPSRELFSFFISYLFGTPSLPVGFPPFSVFLRHLRHLRRRKPWRKARPGLFVLRAHLHRGGRRLRSPFIDIQYPRAAIHRDRLVYNWRGYGEVQHTLSVLRGDDHDRRTDRSDPRTRRKEEGRGLVRGLERPAIETSRASRSDLRSGNVFAKRPRASFGREVRGSPEKGRYLERSAVSQSARYGITRRDLPLTTPRSDEPCDRL